MEDKELFDFFRNRRTSFDEMPPDKVWNEIKTNIEVSKKTSFSLASRIITWGILVLLAVATIMFFIPKDTQTAIEDTNNKPTENKPVVETNPSEKQNASENDSANEETDTLKPKKVFIKKSLVKRLKHTVPVIKNPQPIFKSDSIVVIDAKEEIDSLIIRPQIKGNRLLFETEQLLTAIEFESFIQKVLEETKTNYGALIVIRAKENKPFRQVVKFPEKINIPKTNILTRHYTTKILLKDSLITNDSINFNLKK